MGRKKTAGDRATEYIKSERTEDHATLKKRSSGGLFGSVGHGRPRQTTLWQATKQAYNNAL